MTTILQPLRTRSAVATLSVQHVRPVPRALSRRSFASSTQRSAGHVRVIEVGPRDGLQNEKSVIPVQTKIELVRRLATTGLKTIEAGSFVSPKWVPQMANSSEILKDILQNNSSAGGDITYQWLLPNVKGLENFLSVHNQSGGRTESGTQHDPPGTSSTSRSSNISKEGTPSLNTSSADANKMPSSMSGVDAMEKEESTSTTGSSISKEAMPSLNTSSADANAMPSSISGIETVAEQGGKTGSNKAKHEVSIFMAATEAFSKKNTNCSIAESLERFKPLMSQAKAQGIPVRAYISVALGCPYEGPDVNPHKVAELAAELLEMGADEISVADTTGMGTAPRTSELLRALTAAGIQNQDLAFHFHDTYGQALVNAVVALEHGIRAFDSAVGGLGGCPYSPGATGNVATEDLIHCLHSLGAKTGVDLGKVAEIGSWISEELGRGNESRAGKATLAKARL